jgi:hypothetical protein
MPDGILPLFFKVKRFEIELFLKILILLLVLKIFLKIDLTNRHWILAILNQKN